MKTYLSVLAAGLLVIPGASVLAGGDAAAGKEKISTCIACHGEDGNAATAQTPQPPRLAGQHADYMVRALEDYASGARNNAIMKAFAAALSPADREDIAAYYSGQKAGLGIIDHTD